MHAAEHGPNGPDLNIDFPAYLDAKFAVDSASLNAALYERFCALLLEHPDPRILDLGTGSGAMLRRILKLPLRGEVELSGLDQEVETLDVGWNRLQQALAEGGYEVQQLLSAAAGKPSRPQLRARKRGISVRIEMIRGDLLEDRAIRRLGSYDCVTAHAVMDLLPLKPALQVIGSLLAPEGVFYATLNYDGQTVLLPEYEKTGVERWLIQNYNRAMERRRKRGRKTGGAWSGRRLYQALVDLNFRILGVGSSDWNLFPASGCYTGDQQLFLGALLSMIAREGLEAAAGSRGIGRRSVLDWHRDRLQDVARGRLCLIVHQLDVLARA